MTWILCQLIVEPYLYYSNVLRYFVWKKSMHFYLSYITLSSALTYIIHVHIELTLYSMVLYTENAFGSYQIQVLENLYPIRLDLHTNWVSVVVPFWLNCLPLFSILYFDWLQCNYKCFNLVGNLGSPVLFKTAVLDFV